MIRDMSLYHQFVGKGNSEVSAIAEKHVNGDQRSSLQPQRTIQKRDNAGFRVPVVVF